MSKKQGVTICAVLLILVCVVIGCQKLFFDGDKKQEKKSDAKNVELRFQYQHEDLIWDNVNLPYASFQNKEEFEAEVQKTLNEIVDITKLTNWQDKYGKNVEYCKIEARIADLNYLNEGGSITWPTYDSDTGIYTKIMLDEELTAAGMEILTHELTHLVVGPGFSVSLNEGLSEYCSRKIKGTNSSISKVGINDFLKNYCAYPGQNEFGTFEELKNSITTVIGTKDSNYPFGISGFRGLLWYAYSESFVTFLIEQYGLEKVADLVSNGTSIEDYKKLDSRGLKEIKEDWLKSYEAYTPQVSAEDIENEVNVFLQKRIELQKQ